MSRECFHDLGARTPDGSYGDEEGASIVPRAALAQEREARGVWEHNSFEQRVAPEARVGGERCVRVNWGARHQLGRRYPARSVGTLSQTPA